MITRRQYKRKPKRISYGKRKQSAGEKKALANLSIYLDQNIPALASQLLGVFHRQVKEVTDEQLEACVMTGGATLTLAGKWRSDYEAFILEQVVPQLENGMETGAYYAIKNVVHKDVAKESGRNKLLGNVSTAKKWLTEHAHELADHMTHQAINAINAVIMLSSHGKSSMQEVIKVLRKAIGLTPRQAESVWRSYEAAKTAMLESSPNASDALVEAQADKVSDQIAKERRRQRTRDLAETELSFSYHAGAEIAVMTAVAQGIFGETIRVWCTAEDERVCPVCSDMEGTEIGLNDSFKVPGKKLYAMQDGPPAHPRCRCTVEYIEIDSPGLGTALAGYENSEADGDEEWIDTVEPVEDESET